MFLGGTIQQVPAIQYAREKGYYTILCDYQPDAPGRSYVDEYHCVSTTDKDAVLEVAKKTNVNGIVAYVSDTAAPTAAYVANRLNLPSNPYDSMLILTKKDLFRSFLEENGLNCPRSSRYSTIKEAEKDISKFNFPIMIKPIDSSGSRGISRLDSINEFEKAFEYALENSKDKVVIIEEFIEMAHSNQIGGDVFVVNGKLEFCGFLNCHRNVLFNPNIPIGKSYPVFLDQEMINTVKNELQKIITLLEINMGALNIEVIFGKDGKLYFIEIGPRNGGNLIPDFLKIITEIDFIAATVESALGNKEINFNHNPKEEYYSTYTLHSAHQGKLVDIIYKEGIEENIIRKFIYKEKESNIEIFNGGDKALGFIFLKFKSLEELKYKMDHMDQYIQIQVV